MTYKKSLRHPKASEAERRIFLQEIEGYEREDRVIVCLDESGFAHDMPHTHGYAPVGERCHGVKDWHARVRTNVIGALIKGALLTVGLFTALSLYCHITDYVHRILQRLVELSLLG